MTVGRDDGAHRPALVLTAATAAVAALITVAVVTVPFFRFAYRAPALHIVLETVNAVVALLAMYLVYGRFRDDGRLQELLLGLALGTVAIANLALTAVPDALTVAGAPDQLSAWAPLVVRLVGTVLLVAAALARPTATIQRRSAGLLTAGLLVVLVLVGVAGVAWAEHLPIAVDPRLVTDSSRPMLVAHPVVLGSQGVGILLYGIAAVAFARQADRTGDELVRWVAAGSALAAFARVHYLLYPSLYTEYVYSGDVLRLGFYVFMVVGAAREITGYWQARAQTAVLEDRRRIARDLHDGLIQELSFIHAQSRRLAAQPGDEITVGRIQGAALRAIDESRGVLAALTRPEDADLPALLERSLAEMASRYDVKIVTEIDPAAESDGPIVEALLRITGEAVRNAVRHGDAARIHVRLDAAPLSLTISDDGRGFPADLPEGGRTGGFGLRSMRERAAGIGATLTLDSEPGRGTTVGVSWV
jgi:signal transduction histidine kinase